MTAGLLAGAESSVASADAEVLMRAAETVKESVQRTTIVCREIRMPNISVKERGDGRKRELEARGEKLLAFGGLLESTRALVSGGVHDGAVHCATAQIMKRPRV